jgi:octaheme c-type cytochrome (tetrathionate reductase family)
MKLTISIMIALLAPLAALAQEDHSEFIEGPFSSPQEVTETCLLCHDGIDQEIMATRHWDWIGDGTGKRNLINNFCTALPSNWPRCTSCHIGYGWQDDSFDFTNGNNIDCLICHDQTGTYKKLPTGAGVPDPSVDLVKVAQNVGRTTNHNCGICHFNGGGGPGVKHGDLDVSLERPSPLLDVHMGDLGFTCSDCHAGENHHILGASHGSIASGSNHIGCLGCHDEKPHARKIINNHVTSVACETCHIPTVAREQPTKTWWDWSSAGQDKTVPPDEYGMPVYDKMKGNFVWKKNLVPEYSWYNGQADYYRPGEQVEPGKVVGLNRLTGNREDEQSKIYPFKVMRGKQIYDPENKTLILPKLFGEGGYWSDFDWNKASELGMAANNLPYSGHFGFIETEMYWPLEHMVAPSKESLNCTDCHTRKEEKRLDWEALGYPGDPMSAGGRFATQENN